MILAHSVDLWPGEVIVWLVADIRTGRALARKRLAVLHFDRGEFTSIRDLITGRVIWRKAAR